jgi:hypothetical protein
MSRTPEAKDFGSYTVTTTAGDLFSFADSGMPAVEPVGTKSFKGRIESGQVRIRLDGDDATTTVGELFDIGEDILFSETMLRQASLICPVGTAAIQGHFYNVEASVFLGGA